MSVPDRYTPWIPFAVKDGLRLIRERGIDAIFSTYPIPSAHVIGSLVHRFSGKPWIADFRDPMWDEHSVHDSLALRARKAIERKAAEKSSHVLVATRGMKDLYHRRYPSLPQGKVTAILNGYDEEDFAYLPAPAPRAGGPVTLIHAGLLERVDRNPTGFFRALKALKERGRIDAARFQARLIASGHDADYRAELESLGISDLVSLEAPIAYGEALAAMAASDILLLFQGPTCDSQIPAKLYEYMRIGKPILALATASGETGKLTVSSGGGEVVGIDDAEAIATRLTSWLDALDAGRALPAATREAASAYSRRNQAAQLAGIVKSL
jgi:glycosyltransferase involved in cell wall biosynthesis